MKPLAFVLFALVGSMITIPIQTYADSQLDSLLMIANQARDNIKIRLSQLSTVSDEIARLYEQGSMETDELAKSVSEGDVTTAKQHFLSAMKLFKELSDRISSSAAANVEEPLPEIDTSRLKTAIIRIEKAADRLKAIAIKNNIEIDFTEFDNLIQIAKQNLDAGNVDEVNKTLGVAKQFIVDVHNSISAAAKQMTSDRAKDFAAKQIERLDKLIAQAKDLGLSQDIIDNLQTAKEKLQKISDAKEIVSETKGINTMREKLDASKINRINIIIKQLEEKLDRLDTESQNDDSRTKIQAARDMLVELKQLVSDGKLDEVLQKIKSINKIISSIKTTSDTKATEALDDENKTDEGEATKIDSRLERIKTKIQAQEEQLNSLSESIGENDVAMQWISRAFSLIEKAKLQLDESPEKATSTLNEVDKIIRMVQRLAS
jgi:hypothetical protein